MIVVDTNIIAYFFVSGHHTKTCLELYENDKFWCAPYLWRSEFRNVLALYLRGRTIDYDDSLKIMSEAERFMSRNEYTVNSEKVLGLVNESKCSAYDCEFVALAIDIGKPLITYDKDLLKAFPTIAMSVNDYLKKHSCR